MKSIVKTFKFIILFCLVSSTFFLMFALWAEKNWLQTQQDALAISSKTLAVNEAKQRFVSLDEKAKLKFFDGFLENLGHRDKAISNSINSSFEMARTATYSVSAFNSLAAFCVIYLLVKKTPVNQK